MAINKQSFIRRHFTTYLYCSLLLVSGLVACGGGGGGGGGSGDDDDDDDANSSAPQVEIQFPPRFSMTDGSAITLHGTAADGAGVEYVRVGGVDATTSDNFATWQITVPLTPGTNTVRVQARDLDGNGTNDADSVTIVSGAFMISPSQLVIDSANDRAFLSDPDQHAVLEIDINTGDMTVFSGANVPDSTNPFLAPDAIDIDSANNRLLVTDYLLDAVIAVDLDDGARTILSSNSVPNATNPFSINVMDMVVDQAHNRALVLDSNPGNAVVMAVSLGDGARTVLSNNTIPANVGVNPFGNPVALALDSDNDRLLVMGPFRLNAVALSDGAKTLMSDSAGTGGLDYGDAWDFVVDSEHNRLLATSSLGYMGSLIAEDLNTNVRTTFANLPAAMQGASGIALDSDNNRALVVGAYNALIARVGLSTGSSSILWSSDTPDTNNPFTTPRGVVIDSARNRALVADQNAGTITAVNLDTGARTVLTSSTTPDSTNIIISLNGIALDTANNRVLAVDNGSNSIVAVNLITGARTILSDSSAGINPFQDPLGIVVDSANNRALVTDGFLDAVVAVDLTTGVRSILSDDDEPNATNSFNFPSSIALDSANSRVLVSDSSGSAAIIAVDLEDGARTILSNATVPDTNVLLDAPAGILVDSANNRALVTDADRKEILAVNLTTGARTVFSGASTPNVLSSLDSPSGIALDSDNNRILVAEREWGLLLAVQPDTGERVIFSK